MGAAEFSFKGVKEMVRKVREIADKYPEKIERALYIEANKIMTESKKLCPVAEEFGGTLRSSGFVNKPENHHGVISVDMGYGGKADAYAEAVHETPSKHDPPTWRGITVTFNPPGTGPKFLERPLLAAVHGMAERVAARVAKEMATVEDLDLDLAPESEE